MSEFDKYKEGEFSMNTYAELKKRHQEEVNAFPMFFAFSNKQFDEGMRKLGLTLEDTDKIYRFGDTGGYYRKSDAGTLHEMLDRHERERQEAVKADETGDGYIFDMFYCELANHEYGYTGDVSETLDALGYAKEQVWADKRLLHGLEKAAKKIMGRN